MKKKVFKVEGAEVSCKLIARNPCGPDEYEVKIINDGVVYRIDTLVGPFEPDEDVCNRIYTEWKNGRHNDVIPETI